MALAVFLRAVNVGGRTLRTKDLAARLGMSSIGAAGTFVAPGRSDAAGLAREVRAALPFETEVMVVPGEDVLALLAEGPGDPGPGVLRFVSVLARAARTPRLPVEWPEGAPWVLRVVGVRGGLVTSLRRPREPGDGYPNPIVEKAFGVPATTRGWATLEAVGATLREATGAGLKERAAPPSSRAARSRPTGGAPGRGRKAGAAAPAPRPGRAGSRGRPRGGAPRRGGA